MSEFHTKAQDKARKGVGKKGLTCEQARKLYPWKKSMGDVRAFKYSPKTGEWCYT